MRNLTVGIVDYGVGNHASVRQCLHHLNLRCRVSDDSSVLETCNLLLLPGVGAFPVAMHALRVKGLDQVVIDQASRGKPILGICLGMQLLTEASYEDGYCTGLGLIPGTIVPLGKLRWHIGWNTVETVEEDAIFQESNGQTFFFNHSYAYHGPEKYQVGKTQLDSVFASAIRNEKIIGVQFHPEKSQGAGHALLRRIVEGLCDA